MQTAPKGTYKGMFHCAGGILKNEGPLAFYKVHCINIILTSAGVLYAYTGNTLASTRYRTMCINPVWRSGIHETILRQPKQGTGCRRARRKDPQWHAAVRRWRYSGSSERRRIRSSGTYPYPYVIHHSCSEKSVTHNLRSANAIKH